MTKRPCKAVPIYIFISYLGSSRGWHSILLPIPPLNYFRQLVISDSDHCMILPTKEHTLHLCRVFWMQSSLAPQALKQPTNLPQTHHSCFNRAPQEKCGRDCVSSHPPPWKYLSPFKAGTGGLGQNKQKAHTHKAHIWSSAPVIKPGASVAFSGCLRVQVISPRPAVPFSLFTLYAPIASTTTLSKENFVWRNTKRVAFLSLFILWKEGVEENWWGGKEERTLLSMSHETPQRFQTGFCHNRGKICFNLYIQKS